MPCDPMYIHEPAVICPYIVSPSRSNRRNSSQLAQRPTRVAIEVLPLDQASDALAREATRLVRGKLALSVDQTDGER